MALLRLACALGLAASLLACNRDRPSPGGAPAPGPGTAAPTAKASTAMVAPPSAHPAVPRHAAADPFAARAAAHEKVITALTAAFNAHDPKAIAALYDPAAIVVGPSPGGFTPETGREPLVVGHEALFTSQPDVKSATTRLLIVGDYAVQEWVTTGTAAASGKTVGFQAASVYRFGGDGKIVRDSTYFDLLTTAVQTGKKNGEARPIPPLPDKPAVVVAGESTRDPLAVELLHELHAALRDGRPADLGKLLADDVTEVSLLATRDAAGRDAVVKELTNVTAQLPRVEITGAWGDAQVGAAEVIFSAPPKDRTSADVKIHALHVVDVADGKIKRSTLYANRRELEDE